MLLFFYLCRKNKMKLFNFCIVLFLLLSSCKKDEVNTPIFDNNYGEGMYVVTDLGVSFYNYKDSSAQVQNQIYKEVNNIAITSPKKIKFKGDNAYILGNNYIVIADLNTFEDKGNINGFLNPVDFDFVSPNNRLFVVDRDDSKVKEVNLNNMQITSDIETGDSTRPVFILSNSYKSFVLNGGRSSLETKDSTVVVIESRDSLVGLADFEGSLEVGDNPSSAVITSDSRLQVLCKGIYDPINPINNTESSLSNINQYSNEVYSTTNLAGIFNANNLITNYDNSLCYFTAEGGIYLLNPNTLNTTSLVSINSDVINTIVESVAINDSTTVYYQILYMNDIDTPNSLYKYNLTLSSFVDTLIFDGNIRAINFF